jgi:hypothetical protein
MTSPEPERVAWPVRTIRSKTGDLYVSVDSLMGFRNMMGPAHWHPVLLNLMDHIIREAQRADMYGKEVT